MQRKVNRKFKRETTMLNVNVAQDSYTMSEIFERFLLLALAVSSALLFLRKERLKGLEEKARNPRAFLV